jgi:hypothetical protein
MGTKESGKEGNMIESLGRDRVEEGRVSRYACSRLGSVEDSKRLSFSTMRPKSIVDKRNSKPNIHTKV